ncbi:unnamed protein product [Adineta steineri]|uniref:Uncharacterized protein n=1 Tax=Adineta steineri TaxID=433720 RepID=A0A819H308_9BILA|nr:unnamed protein product [Adineta steineri]
MNDSSSSSSSPSILDTNSNDPDEEQRKKKVLRERAEKLFGYSLSETYLNGKNNSWSPEHYRSLRVTPVIDWPSTMIFEQNR